MSLQTTVGALEIGVLLAIFLFGVLTVQVYIYFDWYPRDPVGFKFLVGRRARRILVCTYTAQVALVWLLDLGHTIAILHLIYTITVTQYGQPALLTAPPRSLDAAILLSGFIGPLEQVLVFFRAIPSRG